MQKYKYSLSSLLIATSSLAFANNPQHISESGMDIANMITIQPHTRSAAVNAKHAQECAEMGGVDVTDNSTTIISKNNFDASVCQITNANKYRLYLKARNMHYSQMANVESIEDEVTRSLTTTNDGYNIEAVAPSGYYWSDPYFYDGIGIFTSFGYEFDAVVEAITNCSMWFKVKTFGGTIVAHGECSNPAKYTSLGSFTMACRWNSYNGDCGNTQVAGYGTVYFPGVVASPEKNSGIPDILPSCNIPSSFIANPINIAVGNKFQQEQDIPGGAVSLSLVRTYNSTDGVWRHNYSSNIKVSAKYPYMLSITLKDGREIDFFESNGIITASSTELGTLKKVGSGYQYTSPFHEISEFNSTGRLTRTVSNGGIVHNISYPNDRTIVVSDNLKDTLTILENADHQPIEVKTSSGKVVTYEYDAEKRLVKVTKNGKSRKYHYEDARFPRALTGITDENGIRYVTWTYDDKGRANSSTHADGKDKVSITYDSDTQTTFTNPLNRKYTYNYTVIDGVKRITSIIGFASSWCPAIGSSYQYNAHGLVTLRSDGKGIKTSYDYNDAGQEISRTIGVGSPNTVTIKTTWDDRFNLPKTETYPDKVITYSYDADGNVTGQTVKSLN